VKRAAKAAIDEDPWGEKEYYARLAAKPKHTVRDHLEALATSTKLTIWFREGREPEVLNVTPENVIAALNRAGICPVLMGTYGIGGYRSEARATEDVDVLVSKRDVPKAVRALDETFPYLEIVDTPVVTRFRNAATQKIVLDLMKPTSEAMRAVFRNSVKVGKTHRIPTLEMAIVSKYLAMHGPTRRLDKKLIDAGDFTNIVLHNREAISLEKLKRLGDRFLPSISKRILHLIDELDAGRSINAG